MRGIRRGALCAALILLFTLLTGCGTAAGSELNFSACLGAAPETLDPIRAGTAQEQTIITQIYENLMKLDTQVSGETTVVNGMAKSVSSEENYDGSVTYTFRLRSAKWSDGRSVKAEDFVYAWQRLADPVSASPNAAILSAVVGYDEVRKSGDVTKLAVTAKNDSTLQVTVTGVCPWFLSDVCTAAATVPLRRDVVQSLKADAQEKNDAAAAQGQTSALTWCSDPTALVTNGAYTVKTYSDSEGLTLARRGGGSGPDTLHFLFAATAEDAWALYEAGTVDFVAPLPQAQLQELAKNPDWSATPELAVQALLFNSSADPFSDPLVRQAFSLATDRTALAAAIPASSAADALVPSGVPGVEGGDDFRTVGGSLLSAGGEAYAADQDKAKSLLAQAGFESGLSFPSLTCYYSAEDSGAAAAAAVLPPDVGDGAARPGEDGGAAGKRAPEDPPKRGVHAGAPPPHRLCRRCRELSFVLEVHQRKQRHPLLQQRLRHAAHRHRQRFGRHRPAGLSPRRGEPAADGLSPDAPVLDRHRLEAAGDRYGAVPGRPGLV
jgi:oligopeptide transport system substrate-binding protein